MIFGHVAVSIRQFDKFASKMTDLNVNMRRLSVQGNPVNVTPHGLRLKSHKSNYLSIMAEDRCQSIAGFWIFVRRVSSRTKVRTGRHKTLASTPPTDIAPNAFSSARFADATRAKQVTSHLPSRIAHKRQKRDCARPPSDVAKSAQTGCIKRRSKLRDNRKGGICR